METRQKISSKRVVTVAPSHFFRAKRLKKKLKLRPGDKVYLSDLHVLVDEDPLEEGCLKFIKVFNENNVQFCLPISALRFTGHSQKDLIHANPGVLHKKDFEALHLPKDF
jgi:hypothetical protein